VNPKAIYAVGGGIAVAAIALFFVVGSGNIRFPASQDGNQTSQIQQEPGLSIRNITVTRLDDERANVQIVFDMYNPNQSPLLLEILQYTLTVDEFRMTGGQVGGLPEGMVASSADLTQIPSETSVPLRSTQVATRNNLNADSWDSMVEGTANYEVTGSYAYRTTARLETTAGDKDFTLTFP
jgi:hypothetical protein